MRPASQNALRSARRLLRAKYRREVGLFLAEGPQAVREALAEPGRVHSVFLTAEAAARHPELTAQATLATEAEVAALTDAVTPQGVVAICRVQDRALEDVLPASDLRRLRLAVCCAEVRDPGNAGTVIRCADAAGADAVLLSAGSVDLYNSKTVRASAGSIFHLPIAVDQDLPEVISRARAAGMVVRATAGDGREDLARLDADGRLAEPTCWLFGNEAHGLDPGIAALADETVSIPVYGAAESLNLATAAAVCLYTSAFAQRRSGTAGPVS